MNMGEDDTEDEESDGKKLYLLLVLFFPDVSSQKNVRKNQQKNV